MAISVLLVDNHAVVRDGLRLLLETQADIRVVGEAGDGRQAIQQAQQLHPDVAVIDLVMPELNGIEATRKIRETCPNTQVLILTMYNTSELIFQAFQAGAKGYVLKEVHGMEVAEAIRKVHTGRTYVSQGIAEIVLSSFVEQRQTSTAVSPLERLSSREREVFQLLAEGKSNIEIASTLSLSPKTVNTYRSRLMQKLGMTNMADLIKFAIQHQLIPLN